MMQETTAKHKMEPTNTTSPEVQQVIDEHLEHIVQDFIEFRERMSQSSSTNDLKDIVDLYINNTCENSYNQDELTTLLQDFNEFTPPPHQIEPIHEQSIINGFIIDGENQTVNVNSTNGVTYMRYGDLNYDGAAGDFYGSVFGSDMNFWLWGLCGMTRVKRVKRIYRWVMESEEEEKAAHRQDRAKLNNRDTDTKKKHILTRLSISKSNEKRFGK